MFVSSATNQVLRLFNLQATQRKQFSVLRQYLLQQCIARDLRIRIQRYLKIVRGTNHNYVRQKDVELFSLLSKSLQEELDAQLYVRSMLSHPFFKILTRRSKVVMQRVCTEAVAELIVVQNDMLFEVGELAAAMYFVTNGALEYSQWHGLESQPSYLQSDQWCSEACLWTLWVHRGTLTGDAYSELIALNACRFRSIVMQHHMDMWFPRRYGKAFIKVLNGGGHQQQAPMAVISDLHNQTLQEDIVRDVLVWQRRHMHSFTPEDEEVDEMRSKRSSTSPHSGVGGTCVNDADSDVTMV
jgi:hypothetical protein